VFIVEVMARMPVGFTFLAILTTIAVPMLQFFLLLLHTFFYHERFEVQCLGYPLINFQISGLPCKWCNNILVSFCEKSLITLYTNVVKPNLVPRYTSYSFQCAPNFKAI